MPNNINDKTTRHAELTTNPLPAPSSRLVTTMFAIIAKTAATHTKITAIHTAPVFVGGLGTAENIPHPHPVSSAICAMA
jgi:hypothetical protein